MDSSVITHTGTIRRIDGHDVTLRLSDTTPKRCDTCTMTGLCSKAGADSELTVSVDSVRGLREGANVTATAQERNQAGATALAILMSFGIFLGIILPLAGSSLPRWVVVMAAIAIIGVYNLLLWRFGPSRSRSIRWTIRQTD
ncbi:MAG: SoxR reducing system RseC family protein [Bacteroidales bacterium]|nr:SoxR reducing system RseC family protein [Bacteroidales bacterium]MBD5377436.1 SoxR reducing system RseC family protein [Bacteroides sp.]